MTDPGERTLQAALAQTHQRMARMESLAGAGDWQMVAETGALMLSGGARRLLGARSADDLTSREALLHEVHEVDRERIRAWLQEAAEVAGPARTEEFRLRGDGGEARKLRASCERVIEDGTVLLRGALMDLAGHERASREELEHARRALDEEHQLFMGIIDLAFDAIIVIDSANRVIVFNRRAEAMFGRGAAQVLGGSMDPLIPARLRAAHRAGIERLAAAQDVPDTGRTLEITGARHDGSEFPLEIAISRIEVAGQLVFTATLRDLTERRKQEAERARLDAQLHQSQKMEAIGALAGGIAHDFNNMLGAIFANLDLAWGEAAEDSTLRPYLRNIREAGQRAKELVAQVLAFSRRQPAARIPVDPQREIAESIELVRCTLPGNAALDVQIAAGLPLVLADRVQLYQIILNLVNNSAAALESEQGTIRVEARAQDLQGGIAMGLRLPAGLYVHITVADTGRGIAPEVQKRIFEPFFTSRAEQGGTGLGLAVVHGIVTDHGGAITVESEVGRGTKVDIWLPALEDAAPAHQPIAPRRVRGRGERVMFVDDEDALTQPAELLLSRLGFNVQTTTDPLIALDAFVREPGRFAALVTDLYMPRMSGLDLAAQLRRLEPGMPVVLCSGFFNEKQRATAAALGVMTFVNKPYTGDELAQTLDQVLHARALALRAASSS